MHVIITALEHSKPKPYFVFFIWEYDWLFVDFHAIKEKWLALFQHLFCLKSGVKMAH